MANKRPIAVVGATGAQGGGLVRAILADRGGPFSVRALTRHPDSEKGRALAAAGAEVVAADLDDPASVERAFRGAYGAFCVTNFWEHFSPERELLQAQHQADAARAAGLEHVIWSTLEDTRRWVPLEDTRMPTLMGQYKVPHFDAKGMADRFFTERGVPTTFLLTTFYWENFIHFGMEPRPAPDGTLELLLPMGGARLAGIAAEDIGRCAYGIFLRDKELVGQTVGIAGELLTGAQLAAALGRALGREVRYVAVPHATYRSLGFPGAEDLGNMFQIYTEFERQFAANRDVDFARLLDPTLQDFETWLRRNKERIPLRTPVAPSSAETGEAARLTTPPPR